MLKIIRNKEKLYPRIGAEIEFSKVEENEFLQQFGRSSTENAVIYEHRSKVYRPFRRKINMIYFLKAFSNYARFLKNEHPGGYYDRRAGSMHAHLSLKAVKEDNARAINLRTNASYFFLFLYPIYLYFLPIAARRWTYNESYFRENVSNAAGIKTDNLPIDSKHHIFTYNSNVNTLEFRSNEFPPFYLPLVPVMWLHAIHSGGIGNLFQLAINAWERQYGYGNTSIKRVEKIIQEDYMNPVVRAVDWAVRNGYAPDYSVVLLDIMATLIDGAKSGEVITMSTFSDVADQFIAKLEEQ